MALFIDFQTLGRVIYWNWWKKKKSKKGIIMLRIIEMIWNLPYVITTTSQAAFSTSLFDTFLFHSSSFSQPWLPFKLLLDQPQRILPIIDWGHVTFPKMQPQCKLGSLNTIKTMFIERNICFINWISFVKTGHGSRESPSSTVWMLMIK